MGLAYITNGNTADELKRREIYPVLTQFGYQAEKQYLTTGNFSALFEFVGSVSGLDQGLFIPTVSVLNEFRINKRGLEFALGPLVRVVNIGGRTSVKSTVLYGFGKTFRSGQFNIPVNVFVSPSKKDGWTIGGSFGFNINKK